MKRVIIYVFLLISIPAVSLGQPARDSLPPYMKNPGIPSFRLLNTDSTWFTDKDLPKDMHTVFIYFSPECSHCQNKARQITERIDSLRHTTFVWASYHPLEEISQFAVRYGLDKFENIKVTRDARYFMPVYFQVKNTPYIVVYNNRGLYSKEFREGARISDLIRAVN